MTILSTTVTLGETRSFSAKSIVKDNVSYSVEPGAYNDQTIDDDWLDDHTNEETDRLELVFTCSKSNNAWNYKVEYYVLFETGQSYKLKSAAQEESATGSFKFVSFFTLPDAFKDYSVAKLEEYVSGSDDPLVTAEGEPVIMLEKGANAVLKVYLVPDDSSFENKSFSTTYNGTAQYVTDKDDEEKPLYPIKLPTLPELADANVKLEPEYEYYLGETKVTNPTNAGIYRVQIKIVAKVGGVSQGVFWHSPEYKEGSRPAILFEIKRCNVVLSSKDVVWFFYNNKANQTAQTSGELPTDLDYTAQLATVARFVLKDTTEGNITYGSTVPAAIKTLLNGKLVISLSADAFRSTPTTAEDIDNQVGYTDNVFSVTLKSGSGLDINNFNFYKTYGKIYLWEDVNVYKYWNGDITTYTPYLTE